MKRSSMWAIVAVFLLVGILISGCSPATQAPTQATQAPTSAPVKAEVIKWKAQSSYALPMATSSKNPATTAGWGAFLWSDWVNKATNGRLQIEWVPANAIFQSAETFTAIGKGMADAALVFPGYYSGQMPEAAIECFVPYGAENVSDMNLLMYQYGLEEALRKVYAKGNVYLMGVFPVTSSSNLGSNIDMSSGPDSIKGKKFRAAGGALSYYVEAIGGTPVPVPYSEVYMAMKLGTVDGFMQGIVDLEDQKLKEVTKYYLNFSTGIINGDVQINMNSWNKLPNDIKEILSRDSRRIMWEAGMNVISFENSIPGLAKNVKYQDWSAEAKATSRAKVLDQVWAKLASPNAQCGQLMDIFKTFAKAYGKM